MYCMGGGCFGEAKQSDRHRPYGALRHPIGNIVQCSKEKYGEEKDKKLCNCSVSRICAH